MSKQPVSRLDWHYTRFGGILAVRAVKIWARLHRRPTYDIRLSRPIDKTEPTVIVSNHQTLLDPPGIFAALPFQTLYAISPVKFMTWHKYYHSKFKFPLYSTGCYPSHGGGLTGVKGAVYFAQHGYRSFIFPEGKRTREGHRQPAYDGIVKILDELPEARLILAHINWEERRKLLSRPKLFVGFYEAPEKLDRSNADAIMDAVYEHGNLA